jgi:uncharacterized protein with HEPN domain
MPSQDPGRRLRDILDHVALVRARIDGMSLEAFAQDTKTRYAVQMALMIMGEAAEALPPELHDRHPAVHWRGLADIGNTFRHQYWAVEHQITWAGLRNELAPLEDAARAELARLEEQGKPPRSPRNRDRRR